MLGTSERLAQQAAPMQISRIGAIAAQPRQSIQGLRAMPPSGVQITPVLVWFRLAQRRLMKSTTATGIRP